MARQVLENGVVLPAEYSDDWYDDMTSNLTKLDDVIGSDSEKLSSTDVGAAALSNNYNDLDNLPTIPTVNDATLTIQKNGEDVQTFTANASSNVTCNITVPTKTSDLTNDSNFVDTSNSAVASGITSAKVTSYDSHVADTDIHVTTADKTKWNNGVSQAFVFRYSSTALVASSTNSNTLLDNTDNLKVGDKVIDSSGVLFSITAIDTVNSTFTVGSALIDLALDANVVHTSGDETVGGQKTWTGTNIFQQNITYQRTNFYHQVANPCYILKDTELEKGSLATTHASYPALWQDKNGNILGYVRFVEYNSGRQTAEFKVSNLIKNGALDPTGSEVNCAVNLELQPSGEKSLIPEQNNDINLGTVSNKWKTFNGLEPSSLSMPDLSNGIDISSYITVNGGNKESLYTPTVNGWISVALTRTSGSVAVMLKQGNITSSGHRIDQENGTATCNAMLPVNGGVQVSINSALADGIAFAYFYPCQGNV